MAGLMYTLHRRSCSSLFTPFGILLTIGMVISMTQIYMSTGLNKTKSVGTILLTEAITAEISNQSTAAQDDFTIPKANPTVNMSNMKAIVLHGFQDTKLGKIAESIRLTSCDSKNCYFKQTSNISDLRLMKSDAVLFNAKRLKSHLPIRDRRGQVYVLVSMEPPSHVTSSKSLKRFKGQLTWSMTYRLNSDIPMPYGAILLSHSISRVINGVKHIMTHLNKNKVRKTPINHNRNYYQIFRQKHLAVAWYQQACTTDSRSEDYVKLLQKHIKVDVYGNCSMSNQKGSITMTTVAKVYKFLLLFEDSMCVDYISDEVFELFQKDIILVLRGAGNYNKHLPLGTFLSTEKYGSPESLAKYLSRLSTDEKSYTGFLQRKDKFTVLRTEKVAESAFCELCKRLNNVDQHKRSNDEWWKYESQCVFPHDLKPFRPAAFG